MIEKIGNVFLNLDYFKNEDLYNEGDDVEEKILQTVKQTDDYTNVLASDNRWPILYQLAKERENIVEPMDIALTDDVLEVGAGMGAVTGALARRSKSVDCIELSKRRSLANAYRNRKYKNIRIFVGNFQDIPIVKKYDIVTLIGVLEYAQSYIKSEHPFEDFLQKISDALRPGGKMYVAIENKLGLKYFAGCAEDHLCSPFSGIEGYTSNQPVKTFSRSQLNQLILQNGFQSTYFYYPYPDYKLPTIIYSDDYLPGKTFSIPTSQNFFMDRVVCFDERKAYSSLANAQELKTLSNSFLVEAVKADA